MAAVEGPLDINGLRRVLPHRYPFLLIDRILSIDPIPNNKSWVGRKCVALKNLTMNEQFFQGHFPHMPIMPGVLIIEALAQTAAVLGHRPSVSGDQDVLIAAIKEARFRKPVVPGDALKLHVEMLKDRGSLFTFDCKAYVENELVAEAEILAVISPKKES